MPKYLIDMPEGWGFGDWGNCPFTHHCCNGGKCDTDCPISNAKEAIESGWVDEKGVSMLATPKGHPVKLYAVREE